MLIEFPNCPVSLRSPFYIERPPIESRIYEELDRPGSVVRVKAPRKMGKSSLLLRVLNQAQIQGYHTVSIDFSTVETARFRDLDRFLRWLCANIALQLGFAPKLNDVWDADIGSKISCTLYFDTCILARLDRPLVLALNEVNIVFEYPEIAKDFLPLLRSWYEQAKQVERFRGLRLVVVHSTEVYVPLQLHQSPFNVGLPIQLSEFTVEQVTDLARRHDIKELGTQDIERLMRLVGGHPYLIRLALYYLASENLLLSKILQEAPTLSGIYRNHLCALTEILQSNECLMLAFDRVIRSNHGVVLEPKLAFALEQLGLVQIDGDRCTISHQLYYCYFQTYDPLESMGDVGNALQQLQRENQTLKQLANLDSLTQLANRRHFDRTFTQTQLQMAREQDWLSIVLCDIDEFKLYNDTYGHPMGDRCLRAVAKVLRDSIRSNDFVARYGGEEFVLLLPHTTLEEATKIAERIRIGIKTLAIEHAKSQGREKLVTISFGVASEVPNFDDDLERLLRLADKALYRAKAEGRDCIIANDRDP
ncbi:MAG: AAA-like domain-containing protein [Cyanobacteria bacterium SBC]|nr:AAA-like domain-containing protein [Cyanobacteria bacterium SBC]